jgi:hypothetical protein
VGGEGSGRSARTSERERVNAKPDHLACVECGREQRDDERGWRGYLTTHEDEPDYERAEAIVFCPECAAREFGPEEGR